MNAYEIYLNKTEKCNNWIVTHITIISCEPPRHDHRERSRAVVKYAVRSSAAASNAKESKS